MKLCTPDLFIDKWPKKGAAYEIDELGCASFTSDLDSSTRPLSSESS